MPHYLTFDLNWQTFHGDFLEIAPGLNLRHAPGHTPGLCILQVNLSESGTWIFTSDMYHVHENYEDNHPQGWLARDHDDWVRSNQMIHLKKDEALVSNGAKVYITGRRQETLNNAIKLYSNGPGSLHALAGDISRKTEVERLAREVEGKEPNGIHLLVNNAGIARDDSTKFSIVGAPNMEDPVSISKHYMNSPEDAWADTFKTNVTAAFYMSMAFLPQLAKGHRVVSGHTSSIVNVSSIAGK
ncbi:MAG: hypothetical protein Q9165_006091 [Trypethelium subeluteriae]